MKMIKLSIVPVIALALCIGWAIAAPSPDAIGVRVAPNPKHYSALRWYESQGFKGSPQSLLVDGYEAIRDGRTVYIDVANVVETAPANNIFTAGDQLYTNIFIISYNQDAEKATEDIFGQILANWKFNNNILTAGTCSETTAQSCVYSSSCASPQPCTNCRKDEYCDSSHDVAVRDTRRLSDLVDMNIYLERYRNSHGGLCPKLESGSYMPNRTISTWPSWQEELGSALGVSLPFDPVNKLGLCDGTTKTGNQYSNLGATFCPNNGPTYTGSCVANTWQYVFNASNPGDYTLTVETTNANSSAFGDLDQLIAPPAPNPTTIYHDMTISVDGTAIGVIKNKAVGPAKTPQVATIVLPGLAAGNRTISINWTNDSNIGGVDSNLRIHKVSFGKPYNSTTCWDEKTRVFADPTPDNVFDLPIGSHAYIYQSSRDGKSCGFSAATESGLSCVGSACTAGVSVPVTLEFSTPSGNTAPVVMCGGMVSFPHQEFTKYVNAADSDPGDNATLTWGIDTSITAAWPGWVGGPVLQSAGVNTQKKIYATQAGDKGTYQFRVTVTDSTGSSTSKICNIGIGATLPTIEPIADQSVYSGEEVRALTVYASEPSKEYPMNFVFDAIDLGTMAAIPNFMSCSATSSPFGELTGRYNCYVDKEAIDRPAGIYQVTVTVTDKEGDSASETFNITIKNDPPIITPNVANWVASTTVPISEVMWEAMDLLSNFPLTYSITAGVLPTGITGATTTVLHPGLATTYTYGTTTVVSTVNGSLLRYTVSGNLSNANVFANPVTVLNYSMTSADKYALGAGANYTIRISNSGPEIAPPTCSTVMRHSLPFNCVLPVSDAQGNMINNHTVANLPGSGNLTSSLAANAITISGNVTIGDVGSYPIQLNATDEFSYTGPNVGFNLRINNYCGDGVVQTPNTEGANGPANNGVEDCDDANAVNNDACDNNCAWTVKTEPYSLLNSKGDAVVYDNNNNTNSAAAVAGGTFIKIQGIMPTPYIWVAQSTANLVNKIRAFTGYKRVCTRDGAGNVTCLYDTTVTETRGQLLGSFATGADPSRTAVNAETGDVWVGARAGSVVTKFDNQGVTLKNCPAPAGTRGVAIAQNGDAWVAGTGSDQAWRLPADDTTCAASAVISGFGSVYGLAIDSDDNLWAANGAHTAMFKADTVSNVVASIHAAPWVYGITVDPFGNAWGGGYQSGGFFKVDKGAAVNSNAVHHPNAYQILGLSTDIYGNIWGGGYTGNVAVKATNAGTTVFTGSAGWGDNHGMCGDSEGQVWAVYYEGHAKVYDGATNAELEADVNVGAPNGTYTYSDMTGLNRAMALRSATWFKSIDGVYQNQHWGLLQYDLIVPSANQTADIFIRANNAQAALPGTPWNTAAAWNALPLTARVGQFVEIKVLMRSKQPGVTPVITNLRIE
ncbi:hypothetical protein HGA34_00200 [Candidatus Falkowbacteria bacterium]|nr:hypothetical protein [Candidatus Falkowbacteria bacterium]